VVRLLDRKNTDVDQLRLSPESKYPAAGGPPRRITAMYFIN